MALLCDCVCVLEGDIRLIAFMELGETAKKKVREDVECWPHSLPSCGF